MNIKRFNSDGVGRQVFYAGDDDSDRAAAYLLCLLCNNGYRVDYLPSPERLEKLPESSPDLFILSDYPRGQVSDAVLEQIAQRVEAGMHLLHIGGWESYHGRAGEYKNSPLERVLPTTVASSDDRVNTWQGVMVLPTTLGPFRSLDWSVPPFVAGYNRLLPRKEAEVLLEGRHLSVSEKLKTDFASPVPLACRQRFGKGLSTALAFDLAPHWVAGMVDWGLPRREFRLPDKSGVWVETGSLYAEFVKILLANA